MNSSAGVELIHYDTAKREIAAAATIDEAKEIRDRAIAYEVYARQALDDTLERQAQLIRRRAERRCGELLREREKAKGARQPGTNRGRTRSNETTASDATTTPVKTLAQVGISKDQSSTWQKLANVPEQRFEEILEDNTTKIPTAAQIVQQVHQEEARGKGEADGSTYEAECPELLPGANISLSHRRTALVYTVPEDLAEPVRVALRNRNLTFDAFMRGAVRAALTPGFYPPAEVEDVPVTEAEPPTNVQQPLPTVAQPPELPATQTQRLPEEQIDTQRVHARTLKPEFDGVDLRTKDVLDSESRKNQYRFTRGTISSNQHKAVRHVLRGQRQLLNVQEQVKKARRALLEHKPQQ
jgi:hypothetical protein